MDLSAEAVQVHRYTNTCDKETLETKMELRPTTPTPHFGLETVSVSYSYSYKLMDLGLL